MANQADTRIWRGATLSVRDAVTGSDTAWVDFANCIDYSMPGVAANKISASTAGSEVDQFRYDIIDLGQGTFNVFDYMDSPFLAAMDTMQNDGETRKFKLVLPEGDRNTRVFDAYVIEQPISGQYRNLWKLTLTVRLVTDYWYLYPAPTAASMSPATDVAAGGATITVTGNNFEGGLTTVTIGGNVVAAADVTVVSRTSLTFVAPAHAAGTVAVTVTTPVGTSSAISGGFVYT